MPTPQNIVSRLAIGHSSPSELDRHVGYGIKERGWSAVTEIMEAEYAAGYRRWWLHNPFGTQREEGVFQLDQYLEAREDGLDWLCNGFSTAMNRFLKKHTDTEAIAYLGTAWFGVDDDDFSKYRSWDRVSSYITRFASSINPVTVPRMSIAFDHAGRIEADHPLVNLIHCVRAIGGKVYIEPLPYKSLTGQYDHWNGFSYIADCGGAIPSWTPPGMEELIAIMPMHLGREKLLAECRKYLAAGYSVTHHATNYAGGHEVNPGYDGFRELGITIEDLIS